MVVGVVGTVAAGIQHIVKICRVRVEMQKEPHCRGNSFCSILHVYFACEHGLGQYSDGMLLTN